MPAHPPSVFLIGPMGSGKSTVGALLAKAMRREFVDSDAVLQERTGVTIAEIFEREGEAGFRRRECKILAELALRKNIVLATGGGAVLDAGNRKLLGSKGTVIYLRASVATQLAHTRPDPGRPLLQDSDPKEVLTRLWSEREPLYRELCDYQVDMDQRAPRAACDKILAWLDQSPGLS